MADFNYKGVLESRQGSVLTYRFYPNFVHRADASGAFAVDIMGWRYHLLRPSGLGRHADFSLDQRCIGALIEQIRQMMQDPEHEEEIPTVLYLID